MKHRSYLLEVTADEFRPKPLGSRRVALDRATAGRHARCATLWRDVGQGFWTARRRWSAARWRTHLRQGSVSFWIASQRGLDIGFFELIRYRRGVKLEGFGLVPERRGLGLGAGLLTAAAREAFKLGAQRVWLRTATDDHPHALPNYLARGFRIHRERELTHPMRTPDAGAVMHRVDREPRPEPSRSARATRPPRRNADRPGEASTLAASPLRDVDPLASD